MTQTLYGHMAIPEKCLLNKPLFKKLFHENAGLDITDKKILKDDIDKIRWVYTLKPSTVNIAAYHDDVREYEEIAVIQIDLINATRAQRIANFVNKAIPYPLVIIFSSLNTIAISLADKRINQADKSKWVVEDTWMTEWFNPDAPNEAQQKFMQDMAIKSLSFVNFYAFYTDIKSRVVALNIADKSGCYYLTTPENTSKRAENLRQLCRLEQEKADLHNKLVKQKQLGQQVELATRIKKMADQINDLKVNL